MIDGTKVITEADKVIKEELAKHKNSKLTLRKTAAYTIYNFTQFMTSTIS